MFVSKIGNDFSNLGFKGYQHDLNSVGDSIMRFNYVFDYETKNAHVEIFKVKKNNDVYGGYEVLADEPIAKIKLAKGGTDVNLDDISNLDRDEAFAYRIVVEGEKPVADSGVKIQNNAFTLVSRAGTTPRVQGAGYLVYPDSQKVGVKYRDFDHPNTGEIYLDKKEQKWMEGVTRTYTNKTGGNLAGLEDNLDYLAKNGYKIQPANPIAGGDNKTSHHYHNKNNFQISSDMGNIENFNSYARKLFQKGIVYVYDGTYTSESLEGIHFQYALRWADKKPQSYFWFKMQGLRDQNLGFGVVPKNKENLRHRVINAPVIYNETTKKIEQNPDYNPNKETLFQIYDGSLVSDQQLSKLDKPIENYENIKSGNLLAINNHDDTIVNYVFQISPKEYKDRLIAFDEFNQKNEAPLKLNSPDGTILLAQFSNFRIDRKSEGGFVTWDANTDIAKMNYFISGYDEKLDQAIVNTSERNRETQLRVQGAYEVQDMALQAAKYWTRTIKDAQTLYAAQVIKGSKTAEKIKELVDNGLLPKEALMDKNTVDNVLNRYYRLAPKGILNKDDVTVKALMQLPLDSIEFAENTCGVLSTSFFSNRATTEDTLGKSRFELMQQENPHLTEPYAKNYLKTNLLFTDDIKNFAHEIISKVNDSSTEKLLNSNGDYTEYGEYVIELMGPAIAKYAFLKSLTGDSLKTKILQNGEVTYDYIDIKDKTSLKALGINANSPEEEAEQLLKLINNGINKLNHSDVDYLAKSISTRINGTNLNSFRLAEAVVKESGLGLAWRLDAAKDVVDQDAGRNGDVAFDENWQNLINFWKNFVQSVKSINPDSYIVAEMTDIADIMRDNLGEKTSCYNNMPDTGLKYKTVPDAMIKFFNETGITSEAAYSYYFTDVLKTFGSDFAEGTTTDDTKKRCNSIIWKLHELINTRGIDYVRNLYTFVGNHDKPRVIHGLALDMKLFHGGFDIFDEHGNTVFDVKNNNNSHSRNNRIEAMIQLTNSDNYNSMPLEAKLNIDNPDYFNTVSSYAIAMSQLLRNAINDSLKGIVSDNEIKYLKSALVDLTNGNYLGSGTTTTIPSINIPELSSTENALKAILQIAGMTVTEKEFNEILKRANDPTLIEKFVVRGDFDWGGNNAKIGERNKELAETILRGAYEAVPSGETDYKKYSTYTLGVTGLLRQAFIDVKGNNANDRFQFLKASKEFFQKYDRSTVEANRTRLPFEESSAATMAKDGFASQDIKKAIEMVVEQAEYKARLDGKLSENQHFNNSNNIVLNVWKNATEPAVQKLVMMMSFLSALVGLPTIYGGDEFGLSGYEEKTKNVFLKCRNPLPWSELEEGIFKEFRERIQKAMNNSMSLRSKDGIDALNHGTAYKMSTSDENVPAFLMQDGYGNMTVSVFNSVDISNKPRFDYFKHFGITDSNKSKFFKDNNIESINPNNRFVPIQRNKDLDYIELGAGISLPLGLVFLNADARDKAEYIIDKIKKKDKEGKELIRLALVKKGGGKISLNSLTAKNGAMVLKHVSGYGKRLVFRGNSNNINKQYKIVTNPYQISDKPIEGEKLSIVSK